MKKYISNSTDETRDLGFRLGRLLRPGDVVGLYGELGAGKTVFAQGIASALGIEEREIVSASFTIISEYHTTPPFTHIDLYRVSGDTELAELGLWEHFGGEGITVVEWAEKAGEYLPEDSIRVSLSFRSEKMREILIEGINEENRDNL